MKKVNLGNWLLRGGFVICLAFSPPVQAQLTINPPTFPSGNTVQLTLSGTQPTNTYLINSTTNLAVPMSNWTPMMTGAVGQVTFDLDRVGTTAFYRAAVVSSSLPTYPPAFDAVTGPGVLQLIGPASNCITSASVWIADVKVASVGNDTLNVTFSIEGGVDGAAYDVFSSSVLGIGPNVTWTWEGQGYHCETYMLTNMPGPACFLILGTPQNSDNDGLTDAYERLVSHTAPNNPDTSGDGLLDGWKVLWGLNPLTSITDQTSERLNYNYTPADWLEQVSGISSGTVSLDNEGNVLTVSQ